MNMVNLAQLSDKKLNTVKKILEILLSELEHKNVNNIGNYKIDLRKFEREGLSFNDLEYVLNLIDKKTDIIELMNVQMKSNPPFTFDPIASKAYGVEKQQIDYQEYLNDIRGNAFIKLKDKESIKRLKTTISAISHKMPNSTKTSLTYDKASCVIKLGDKAIKIPPDTNQDELCEVVLKNKTTIHKEWSYDEILEQWGDDFDTKLWRRIYSAAREINAKVAIETGIKDFFITTLKTVQINPQLV